MKIRVGYELIYDFPQSTPMIMVLGTHFTRASDVIVPDYLTTSPSVPISPYRDGFGNWCSRIVAPTGRMRLSADGVVRDGIDPLLTLPISTFVTALVGVAIGLPALRLPGLQLAIVTFGIAAIVPQLILKLSDFTGGVTGLNMDVPVPPGWFFGDQEAWLYYLCAAGAGLCALVMLRLVGGDTGRTLRALWDNTLIAQSMGIDLARRRPTWGCDRSGSPPIADPPSWYRFV